MKFEELRIQVEKDLFLDESNAAEKSLKFPSIYSHYLIMYVRERKKLNIIELDKNKLYSELYNDLKYNSEKSLDSMKEAEIIIKGNDRYYKKCVEFQDVELVVKYLEGTLKNITLTSYWIKAFIDQAKLKMGIG